MKRFFRFLLALFCAMVATSCITIPLSFVLPFNVMPVVSFFVGVICGSITSALMLDWIMED